MPWNTVVKSAVVYWIRIPCVWLYLHVFPARADIPGGLPSPVSPHLPSLVEETQAAAQRRKRRKAAGGGCNRSCVDAVQRTTSRYDLVDMVAWCRHMICLFLVWKAALQWSDVIFWTYQTVLLVLICVDSLSTHQLSSLGPILTFSLENSALLWTRDGVFVWCQTKISITRQFWFWSMCIGRSSLCRLPLLCELLCRYYVTFFWTMTIWSCVTSRPHRRADSLPLPVIRRERGLDSVFMGRLTNALLITINVYIY